MSDIRLSNKIVSLNLKALPKVAEDKEPKDTQDEQVVTKSSDNKDWIKIDLTKNDKASLGVIKENTKQIKSLTQELKELKIPANATKDDINNFITQVNTMRKQVGELYHQASQAILSTRYPEKDDLEHAYQEFNDLALSKLEEANFRLDMLKGIYRPMLNQGKNTQMQRLNSIDKVSVENFQKDYSQNHMTKEQILAMGFTENEINEYFYSTAARMLNENGEYVLPDNQVDTFAVKKGVQVNGRTVNSLDDLKYELFRAPIIEMMNKVRAGAISQEQIIRELQIMGATNVEEKSIGGGMTLITYTYRGVTDSFIPQNLSIVEEPKTRYDENGEAFITLFENKPYSRESLRDFGFTDADLAKYFDKKNVDDIKQNGILGQKLASQVNSKDGYCYQLKSGIIINGYEVKTVAELYYFAVLSTLK